MIQKPALAPPDLRLQRQAWALLTGFLVVAHLAEAAYGAAGMEMNGGLYLVMQVSGVTFMWFWLVAECRPYNQRFPLDMGLLLYATSYLLAVHYLWRAQRWRGLGKCGVVLLLWGLAHALSAGFGWLLAGER
jgi:hypothetical protein